MDCCQLTVQLLLPGWSPISQEFTYRLGFTQKLKLYASMFDWGTIWAICGVMAVAIKSCVGTCSWPSYGCYLFRPERAQRPLLQAYNPTFAVAGRCVELGHNLDMFDVIASTDKGLRWWVWLRQR